MISTEEIELAKKVRFQLLEDMVKLDALKKVFIHDIDSACNNITKLRTELLSLINNMEKTKGDDNGL